MVVRARTREFQGMTKRRVENEMLMESHCGWGIVFLRGFVTLNLDRVRIDLNPLLPMYHIIYFTELKDGKRCWLTKLLYCSVRA